MNPVIFFEIPADDKKRAATFYAKAFGWMTAPIDPDPKIGTPITTADLSTRANLPLPKVIGRLNGELYKRPDDPVFRPPAVVIAVNDLNESMKKIRAAGGQIYGDPLDVAGLGLYSSVIDTEGNRIGMIQLSIK